MNSINPVNGLRLQPNALRRNNTFSHKIYQSVSVLVLSEIYQSEYSQKRKSSFEDEKTWRSRRSRKLQWHRESRQHRSGFWLQPARGPPPPSRCPARGSAFYNDSTGQTKADAARYCGEVTIWLSYHSHTCHQWGNRGMPKLGFPEAFNELN